MKKIIGGVAYDTDTADLLVRSDHGHEMSQAWWALYRTSLGAFFAAKLFLARFDAWPISIRTV